MIGIYKITNNLNNKSYIGQSIHIEKRWEEHLYKSSKSSLIQYVIYKYGKENFTFEILEECEQSKLNEREQYWIKFYNSFENGYNLTLGGGGTIKYSSEAIYEDYIKTQSMNQTAKNFSCHINTVRNVLKEYGIEHFNYQKAKNIDCIDTKTLKIIKTFYSIQEAADEMNVERNAIKMALEGIHKTSAGYYWKYSDENKIFTPIEKIKKWKTKVFQIDKTNNQILNTFESAADAAEYLGKDRKNGGSQITAVCNGRKKSAYGYIWKKDE